MASLFTAVLALTSQMSVERNKYKEVSVDIYLSQKGWHEPNDRMLVWMSTQNNAFTMLPKCAGSVTKGNVDALGLRAPNPADGGDPSDVPEPYVWRTLRAKLGAGATTVSVCAALQTGAGAEALYLDNVALHEQSTAGTCSPLGKDVLGFTQGASGNGACKPVVVDDSSPQSPSLEPVTVIIIAIVIVAVILIILGLYFCIVRWLRFRRSDSADRTKASIIVSDDGES